MQQPQPEPIDPQEIATDKEFDTALDETMLRLYDLIKESKPRVQFIRPVLTMFRRADYNQPLDPQTTYIPETAPNQQMDQFIQLGASAANFQDGKIPAFILIVSMGYKVKPSIGAKLDEQQIADSQEEVIMVSGGTMDGRVSQAIYAVTRGEDKGIEAINLITYVPARNRKTDRSELKNGMVDAFYAGFSKQFEENQAAQRRQDGGTRHGGIILPD